MKKVDKLDSMKNKNGFEIYSKGNGKTCHRQGENICKYIWKRNCDHNIQRTLKIQ